MMKQSLVLAALVALLTFVPGEAKATPAICKNKKCNNSGTVCDRTTIGSSCGVCMAETSSGSITCKGTTLGICIGSSYTHCPDWSSSTSGSGSGSASGSGSSSGNSTTPQPTQPTQPPQPTQPTQPPQSTQSPTTPAVTDNLSTTTPVPTKAETASSINWVLYGSIGGGVFVVLLAVICCCIVRKRRADEEDDSELEMHPYESKASLPPTYAAPTIPSSTVPTPAYPMASVMAPEPATFQLPVSPRSSSSAVSLPRSSGMSGYEVSVNNPLTSHVARASIETATAPYRQTIAQKFDQLENFNEGVGSDSESEPSLSFNRGTNPSFNSSEGSNDSFVIASEPTRTDSDRKANNTNCSVEF